jgi:hypothetical protein
LSSMAQGHHFETGLLHSDLKESILMEIPSDMEVDDGKCRALTIIVYGLLQSVRQLYVKPVKALKSCGFTGTFVYPCLWVKQFNTGIVMMAIYVDDCLTIGSDEVI